MGAADWDLAPVGPGQELPGAGVTTRSKSRRSRASTGSVRPVSAISARSRRSRASSTGAGGPASALLLAARVAEVVAERRLQTQHRLRVELRDARLGQPEHGAHLL